MSVVDYEMSKVLFRLELLSYGSTQSFNSSGGGQEAPDAKVVAAAERAEVPRHVYWRERYKGAHKPESKQAVYLAAKAEVDAWSCRPVSAREAADAAGDVKLEDLILNDDRGKSPDIIARQRNIHPDLARRIRKKAGVSTEDGQPLLAEGLSRADQALALKERGLTQAEIAARLELSQPTVHRLLKTRRWSVKP